MAEEVQVPPRRPHGWNSKHAADMKRAKFLEMYALGGTVETVLAQIPASYTAYENWRKVYPEFASEVNRIRAIRGVRGPRGVVAPRMSDFTAFRKKYFGLDTYKHHARIIYEIENASPGEVVLILVPPEAGKTTLLEDYCNKRIANDPNMRITLVSEGQPHARKILGRVQKRMVDRAIANEYICDYGPFHTLRSEGLGKAWASDKFTVYRADHDERDYTMEARGWKSRISGTRTDLLLIDDIQSVVSLSHTEKMVETFRQDMLTRPGKSGVTIIVGTRVGVGDFYEVILNEGIVDRLVVIPAMDEEGNSYCPEMWPVDELTKRRNKVGEAVWFRTYMQRPRQAGSATFTREALDEAKNISRKLGDMPEHPFVIIGLDPALTNWNCFHVAACNSDGFHVVDLRRDRALGSTEQVLARLDTLAVMYHPDVVVIEGNAYQKALANDERLRRISKERGFSVIEHATGRNKLDESLGVARMSSSFAEGRISFPWADENTRREIEPLLTELENWRPGVATRNLRQDQVMAMWFAWLEWQRRSGTLGQDRPRWKAVALPWRPTGNPIRARKAS